jgi:hypothetical protein
LARAKNQILDIRQKPRAVAAPASQTAALSPDSLPSPAQTISGGLIDITFTSTPPNAVVSIGRMALGRTPFTTKLSPGIYKATFYATGYEDLVQQVTVAPGDSATLNATLKVSANQ